MKENTIPLILVLVTGIVVGIFLTKFIFNKTSEGFDDASCISPTTGEVVKPNPPVPEGCPVCGTPSPVICPPVPPCREPDLSKYVLKASIPPSTVCPDISNYILKTQIPPVPDMSKYVLKSSIPRQQPVILDCSKCSKSKGECPPCPRPRCPEVKCAPAPSCPPQGSCPPCPAPSQPKIKCQATDEPADSQVRPYLAPISFSGFGTF